MKEELIEIARSSAGNEDAVVDRILERLLSPSPEMIRAMETVGSETPGPPGVVDLYQAAIWAVMHPSGRARL
jgi:hypothetical protein